MLNKSLIRMAIATALGAIAAPSFASSTFHLVVPLNRPAQNAPVDSIMVSLAGAALPPAIALQPYSHSLRQYLSVTGDASFDAASATWSLVSGSLPTGILLDSATGLLSGTPTAATSGPTTFTVKAAYKGKDGQADYSVEVKLNLVVSLASAILPDVALDTAYTKDLKPYLSVTGDPAYDVNQVTWSVSSGTLPTGLSLSSVGVLTGTSSGFEAEGRSFEVQAAYKDKTAKQTYSVLPKDPYWANVKAFLPFDGNLVDQKTSTAWTAYNGAKTSASQPKFGSGALDFTGLTNAGLVGPAFKPTGSYTIEGWIYPTSLAGRTLVNVGGIVNVNWQSQAIYIGWPAANQLTWVGSSGNNGTDIVNEGNCTMPCTGYAVFGTPALNAWNHFAVVRDATAGKYYLYLNGQRTKVISSTKAPYASNYGVTIGNYPTSTQSNFGGNFNGAIDELRITDGVARYIGATYTVPQFQAPKR